MTVGQKRLPSDSFLPEARALLGKDLRAELRTRTAVSAVAVFALSALFLMGLATARLKGITAENAVTGATRPVWDSAGKMGLLWVLLYFSAFAGLAHTFVHEEEAATVTALRLTMQPEAVYLGKLTFNLLLVMSVTTLVTPAYMLVTGMTVGSPIVFLGVMLSGCIGLAAASTIVGALAAKAHGTGALFGAIGLPLLAVFLMLLMNASMTLYAVEPATRIIVRDVGGLLSYGILMIAVSLLTFRLVWEE
jgi:heme exporter protein B